MVVNGDTVKFSGVGHGGKGGGGMLGSMKNCF